MERLVCLAVGYLFGIFQTGYIYGRVHGIDIRKYGSGNSGSTNALRVMGKKAGLTVFLGDFLKTVIPCMAVRFVFKDQPDYAYVYMLYIGLGVILGHNYPFYLHFKGGKGIAATIGLIMCLSVTVSPLIAAFSYGLGIIGVLIKGYVSMGSLMFVITVPFACYFTGAGNEITLVVSLMTVLAAYQHRANIERIIHGNERSLYKKKQA